MRNPKIKTFYNPQMAISEHEEKNYSMSPMKPKLLMEHITKKEKKDLFEIDEDFDPFGNDDFLIAHSIEYVNGFFNNISPWNNSSSLQWTPEFARSVRYTNSSLYNAIRYSILYPETICFSPTSGFHHAKPHSGEAFCTFSGQVIASKKIYDEFGLSAAYVDLDAHFGNSIEDSYEFVDDLNKIITVNLNPTGIGSYYIRNFRTKLVKLKEQILDSKVHYLVFCHGADSTIKDDLKGQLSDKQWLKCSEIFYNFVKEIDSELGRPIPLTISLFGGYRKFAYDEVLDLHLNDLIKCREILYNNI